MSHVFDVYIYIPAYTRSIYNNFSNSFDIATGFLDARVHVSKVFVVSCFDGKFLRRCRSLKSRDLEMQFGSDAKNPPMDL